MKTKTSHLGFLAATLCGLAIGVKLAAGVGRTRADPGAQTSVEPALDTPESDLEAGEARDLLAQPERPSERDRRRPGPDRHDRRFTPQGDTCLAFGVESADGRPLPGAHAALFTLDGNRPQFPAIAQSAAGPNGVVYTRTGFSGEIFVLVFAPGFVPLARRASTRTNEAVELAPFVLQRGETIRGRVTAGGSALPRAEIEATVEATGDPALLQGGAIAWRLGHFAWIRSSADSASDGSYEIAGLEQGEHAVRIHAVRQRDAAVDVAKVKPLRATAPATGVDFELPAARLELSFETAAAPLCCVEVQIDAGDRQYTRRTDENGKLAMMIQPALAYPITAARVGYTTVHTQLRGLVDGERSAHKLALEPQRALATVVVDDQGTTDTATATFDFHPRFPSAGGEDFECVAKRDPATGRFQIPLVPSGPWRVTLRSGTALQSLGTPSGSSPPLSSNCDADFVVDVPESGTVSAAVTVVSRGCARIAARDVAGRRVDARGILTDTHGASIDTVLLNGREMGALRRGEGGALDDSTYVFSSLCAGPADLLLHREGFEDVKVRVVFAPGQVAQADAVMRAK